MGKDWDRLDARSWEVQPGFSKPGIGERKTAWPSFGSTQAANPTCGVCGGRLRGKKKCSCTVPQWKPMGPPKGSSDGYHPQPVTIPSEMRVLQGQFQQRWHERWLREAFRVLVPGGHIKAMGSPKMFHRLAKAMEQMGFVHIRIEGFGYGSGFPKNLDVSKAIDRSFGAEREIVGYKKGVGGDNLNDVVRGGPVRTTDQVGAKGIGAYGVGVRQVAVDIPVTIPATPQAEQFDGYGSALKPAWEPVLVGEKPTRDGVAAHIG